MLSSNLKDLASYEMKSELSVFIGTWNVGGKKLNTQRWDISQWLCPTEERYDIYAIGLQEMVDLSAMNVLIKSNTMVANEWKKEIKKIVAPNDDYRVIYCNNLVGIFMVVLVRTELSFLIKEIESKVEQTGFFGTLGNKGNLTLHFKINNKTFAFTTGHLAAGHEKNETRMKELIEIIHKPITYRRNQSLIFKDHDFAFIFGDLNFRVDQNNSVVRTLISSGDLAKLQRYDQLTVDKYNFKIDKILKEGKLNFNPTYKYNDESDEYDTSKKDRIPGWTDRVLFMGTGAVEQVCYNRAELNMSDHRPVFAIFNVTVLDNLEKRFQQREVAVETVADIEEGVKTQLNID